MAGRDRDLRIVAAAIAISAIGDWVALLALALRMHELWSSFGIAALFISLWSPIVLLSGHVGIVVDRFETRKLAIVATLAQGAAAVALAFADGIAPLLVLTFLLGAGAAVSQAAEFALLPLLAGSRPIAKANGIVESMRAVGFTVGPLIGGALAAAAGTRIALLVDAATFGVIAAALAAVAVRRPGGATGAKPRAREGITLLYSEPVLAITMTIGAVSLVFMSASIPGDFAYIEDVLGLGGLALGAMLTVWAIGMLLGSNTIPHRVRAAALAPVTMAAVAVQGFAKFLAPFWLAFGFMLVCYAFGGAAHGVKNTGFRTLIHQRVPSDRHGRAFAAYNGLRNSAELVALAGGGALVALVGGRGTLWIAGGAAGLAGLVGLIALGSRRAQVAASADA